MKTTRSWILLLLLLVVLCSGLAARMDRWFMCWRGNREQTGNPLKVLIGQGQRLFAPFAYREADVYFHSGFYPSIYDNRSAFKTEHIAVEADAAVSHNTGDDANFLGKPLDFFDAFSRHFYPTVHTHLTDGGAVSAYGPVKVKQGPDSLVGEILPWLWLSVKLNPDQPQVYSVTAYWLCRMDRYKAAINFLREGLRHNPDDPSLLFEIGNIYYADRHDLAGARDVWEATLKVWEKQTAGKPQDVKYSRDNQILLNKLYSHLAMLEEQADHYEAAIARWKQAKPVSPDPHAVQVHIDRLKQKLAAQPATASPTLSH